jgi:soluble lytic murein transglycosylase-like protein
MAGGRVAQWSRRLLSIVVLCASVLALALIVESQQGQLLFGETLEQPADALPGAVSKPGRDAAVLNPAEESRYRALSGFVANRYRVSQDVAYDLVRVAHQAGNQLQLDPLLIIAVIAVESRFNPIAESVAGAKGLMQIIPKYHTDKLEEFGGEKAVYDPAANIQVGAQILKEYLRLTGNLGSALQMYAGALGDSEDQYSSKVLNEKYRLQQALSQTVARAPAPAAVRTASTRHASILPLD